MCTSPRIYRPLHTYVNTYLNCNTVNAGCGKCEECQEIKRNEWVNRFCFEFDSNKGGKSVFLTFTYNNEHLPHFTDGDFSCTCFNHSDVLTFLGSLEDYYMYRFGFKPYKYFFTCEYGKNTKRPHYHALFFLDAVIANDWRTFVEVCREIWSAPLFPKEPFTAKKSLGLGYMFPLAKDVRRTDNTVLSCTYIDTKGKDRTPLIRAGVKGMVYCSKYTTKDMSFYSEAVSDYLSSDRGYKLKPFLPKHWQSKKLGYSAVDAVLSNVDAALSDGILNPLTCTRVPIPNYVMNRLLYINVFRGRISSTTGKKLYDRELSLLGRKYLVSVFKHRVCKTAVKMSALFQSHPEYNDLLLKCDITDGLDFNQFIPVALYHNFYKNFNKSLYELIYRSTCSVSDMMTLSPIVCGFYLLTKDTAFQRLHPCTRNNLHERDLNFFGDIPLLDAEYCFVSRKNQSKNVKHRINKRIEAYDTAEKFTHGYPINLC